MKRSLSTMFLLVAAAAFSQTPVPSSAPAAPRQRPAAPETPNTDLHYKLAPDAVPQEGVPRGEMKGPFTLPSEVYPGTQHTYWVYVPAQYDCAVAGSLMIFQGGQASNDMEG